MSQVSTGSTSVGPIEFSARSRRYGAWYVTEHKIRQLRGYLGTS